MKGKILAIVQFACLALLLKLTKWNELDIWTILGFAISGLLATWSMLVMRFGNFNVVPKPVEKGVLVTQGPYSVIRHPMYASVFIFLAALLTGQFDFIKLIVSLILVVDLVIKMLYEENLLLAHYHDYQAYMQKTKRVIPFVW